MNDDPMDMQMDSVSVREPAQIHQPSQSGTNGHSTLNNITLSTVSVTLSVKSLNKLNVLAITNATVTPSLEWRDLFYFSDTMKKCLKRIYRNEIDSLCSYGWPHIMQGNSLLLIGEQLRNQMLCLPTFCTIVNVSNLNQKANYIFVIFK